MFAFRYKFEFSYDVDSDGTISIAKSELGKMAEFPDMIAQELLHFINDFASAGARYAVYVDIEQNKLGRARIANRTVIPQD